MSKERETFDVLDGEAYARAGRNAVRLTHLMYFLHALGLVIGAWSQAVTLVGAFVFGWGSIIAIVLNYIKRSDVRGTFLASHFQWQADTFWRCLVVMLIALVLYLLVVGFLINWLLLFAVGIWAVYRIIKGWLALSEGKPVA